MKRGWLAPALLVAGLVLSMLPAAPSLIARPDDGLYWIWFDEGDPAREAPAAPRFFRKTFHVSRTIDEAILDITADDEFTVWMNGVLVGKGNKWKRVYSFDVKKHFAMGRNVIAVKATNVSGPAGLLVRLGFVPNGVTREVITSNASWKSSKTEAKGWQATGFDDDHWPPVKVLGPYGKTGIWKDLVWDIGGDDRFSVPPGFAVEMAAKNPDPKDPFSLINLTFDNRGRLLVSQEGGPTLLCTNPDAEGVFQTVRPYCSQIRSAQGMCWVNDSLLLMGNGPQGTGLYQVRDKTGGDRVNDVKLLHKFQGGMGEHGPHAILHGPDNWLYVVTGNHAWAHPDHVAANSPLTRWPRGQMGRDQGKPGTTEDVLLPRLNDANGHAANILAPGGTIWRLDQHGKQMSLVAAGFRNAYDAAFSPDGELFTFDSDMEWDLELPWYRGVRVCHCPPGADFLWRTGSANTPDYYIDSLPPLIDTGRGSPVGLEFYDHNAFPKKYRGAYFLADWSLGLIYAVRLEKHGATYKGKPERFCLGNPMNVTDIAVGPDGAIYFTMGGRGSRGGVYRIVYRGGDHQPSSQDQGLNELLGQPQPLAAWSRARIEAIRRWDKLPGGKNYLDKELMAAAQVANRPAADRIRALDLLQNHWSPPEAWLLTALAEDASGEIRAHAVWLLGVNGYPEGRDPLTKALADRDALVRRRACEALIRAGVEPPLSALWPLLDDPDRFVRTAARLVLQRIKPEKWTDRLWREPSDRAFFEAVTALCKMDQASPYASQIFVQLNRRAPAPDGQPLLDYLRVVQLALVHITPSGGPDLRSVAERCARLFPHEDWRASRELAILLTHFRRSGMLTEPMHGRLLGALLNDTNRLQQIHYFYCLRLLHEGWTAEQKSALLKWYDSTKDWQGGHSFPGFLDNILRDANEVFTSEDRLQAVRKWREQPWAAAKMLQTAKPPQVPPPAALADVYSQLPKTGVTIRNRDLRALIVEALGRSPLPEAQAALRKISDHDPSERDEVARSLARYPSQENWPYLVRGLNSSSSLVIFDVVDALKKIPNKPKADDAAPFRAVLSASGLLAEGNRWSAVELLRHWGNNKQFGADDGDWKTELAAWSRWFGQAFPKESPLPNVTNDQAAPSKYQFGELLAFLDQDPSGRRGNVARGRIVFDKAQCIKCHKFGTVGEGLGPDLTTVSKRFKRADILESLVYPSKVISDQYRSTTIITKKGQQITGLAAPQGDRVTVLLSDGNKVVLQTDEIDRQLASLVSVMPEKLLDTLTKPEIADLFAFLESEPK
jgi:putative heme-binding domain-containing protein